MFKEINLRNHSSLHKLFYSLNCFEKTSQIISELLHTQNILDDNIIWMNHFSKLNDIALEKLDFAQKILHFEKIKPTDISKIKVQYKNLCKRL